MLNTEVAHYRTFKTEPPNVGRMNPPTLPDRPTRRAAFVDRNNKLLMDRLYLL